jgi:isoleucyl-tRNA synthetase
MVASHDGESVALDLALTPALLEAGMAREAIRFIQERRKSDGLEIADRIHVKWNSDDASAQAISSEAQHICDEVLALTFERDLTMGLGDNELGLSVQLEKA